jgi:adenosylmethionine-8-amino-7-oxononanoate aminotransferase
LRGKEQHNQIKSGISSAIDRLTNLKEREASKATKKLSLETVFEKALDQCASMFAEKVTDVTYIGYIKVLENKNKARTFLTLARTLLDKIYQMWLEKEVSKMVVRTRICPSLILTSEAPLGQFLEPACVFHRD